MLDVPAFEVLAPPDECAPEIAALHAYWRSIHPAAGLPGRQHFDPVAIPALLANIWLLDVTRDPLRFRFRLVGTAIRDFTGRDSTGRFCDEVYPEYEATSAFACARACALRGTPQYRIGRVLSNPERWYATAERLYLPMATNGRDVDLLLAMTRYRNRERVPRWGGRPG